MELRLAGQVSLTHLHLDNEEQMEGKNSVLVCRVGMGVYLIGSAWVCLYACMLAFRIWFRTLNFHGPPKYKGNVV